MLHSFHFGAVEKYKLVLTNVIQWMYKKEQVQTTLSKIIQCLCVLLFHTNILTVTFEKLFCYSQLTSSQAHLTDYFLLSPYLTTFDNPTLL
jgi:hypothetical protein